MCMYTNTHTTHININTLTHTNTNTNTYPHVPLLILRLLCPSDTPSPQTHLPTRRNKTTLRNIVPFTVILTLATWSARTLWLTIVRYIFTAKHFICRTIQATWVTTYKEHLLECSVLLLTKLLTSLCVGILKLLIFLFLIQFYYFFIIIILITIVIIIIIIIPSSLSFSIKKSSINDDKMTIKR